GASLMFSHLCGLASQTLVCRLVSPAQDGPAPSHPGDPYLTQEHHAQINALVAQSQHLLRQSQARAACQQHAQERLAQPATPHQ
ncbi:MAG: hypothetical protein RSG22_17455, partial [Comamonas sp.]